MGIIYSKIVACLQFESNFGSAIVRVVFVILTRRVKGPDSLKVRGRTVLCFSLLNEEIAMTWLNKDQYARPPTAQKAIEDRNDVRTEIYR